MHRFGLNLQTVESALARSAPSERQCCHGCRPIPCETGEPLAARPAMRPAIGFLPGYRAAIANSFRMVLAVLIVTLSLMLEPAVFIQFVFA